MGNLADYWLVWLSFVWPVQCVSSLVLCTVILADYCLVWLSFVWPVQLISSSVLCAVVGYGEPADRTRLLLRLRLDRFSVVYEVRNICYANACLDECLLG